MLQEKKLDFKIIQTVLSNALLFFFPFLVCVNTAGLL